MADQAGMAELFRSMHRTGNLLVLPNAWDVPSARVFFDAGFGAVATSSAAMAVSLGYPDGQLVPRKELFASIAKITKAIPVPVTADIEAGFAKDEDELKESIRGVIDAGAVGVNLEDISNFERKELYDVETQVSRLRIVRETAQELGVPLVVNARTDAFRLGTGAESARVMAAIVRCKAYVSSGVDCVYPMGLTLAESISTFVRELKTPTNVMARKGLPSIPELQRLGVRRLSLGPNPMYATMGLLKTIARELKQEASMKTMLEWAITFDELNDLARTVPSK